MAQENRGIHTKVARAVMRGEQDEYMVATVSVILRLGRFAEESANPLRKTHVPISSGRMRRQKLLSSRFAQKRRPCCRKRVKQEHETTRNHFRKVRVERVQWVKPFVCQPRNYE